MRKLKDNWLKVEKVGCKYQLNDRQLKWLRKAVNLYPNWEIAERMEIKTDSVNQILGRLHIKRTKQGLTNIQLRSNPRRKAHSQDYYARKRGKPLSTETQEGLRKWRSEHEGYSTLNEIQKTDPERYARIRKQAGESMKETYRKERMRLEYGLPLQHNFHEWQLSACAPYTKADGRRRFEAKKKGYILGDPNPKFGERYTLYYDEETERSEPFEANSIERGWKVLPLPDD